MHALLVFIFNVFQRRQQKYKMILKKSNFQKFESMKKLFSDDSLVVTLMHFN